MFNALNPEYRIDALLLRILNNAGYALANEDIAEILVYLDRCGREAFVSSLATALRCRSLDAARYYLDIAFRSSTLASYGFDTKALARLRRYVCTTP